MADGITLRGEKRRRRITGSVALLAACLAFGWLDFHLTTQERNAEIARNLHPASAILNPTDITTTDFSIINDSGTEIVSELNACHGNEAFGPSGIFGGDDSVRMAKLQLIKPGGDVTVTQCLQSMNAIGSALHPVILNCADVVLTMEYMVNSFPKTCDQVDYRFLLTRYKDQYQWTRQGPSIPNGLCGGAPLPKVFKPLSVPCTEGSQNE
jgi:hypothetical protein